MVISRLIRVLPDVLATMVIDGEMSRITPITSVVGLSTQTPGVCDGGGTLMEDKASIEVNSYRAIGIDVLDGPSDVEVQ